jgi:hypothetical protein
LKRCLIYATTLIILSIFGCQNSSEKNTKSEFKDTLIDYYNIEVLDSIIKSTPNSSDTIFLGFILGTTKSEYDAQIRKLKKMD